MRPILAAMVMFACGSETIPVSEHVEQVMLIEVSDVSRVATRDIRREIELLGQCVMFFHGEEHNFAIVRDKGFDGSGCAYEIYSEALITYLLFGGDPSPHVVALEWLE